MKESGLIRDLNAHRHDRPDVASNISSNIAETDFNSDDPD